jgi:hypothetical protein
LVFICERAVAWPRAGLRHVLLARGRDVRVHPAAARCLRRQVARAHGSPRWPPGPCLLLPTSTA